MTSFDKPPLGAGKLLLLLQERGLEINDKPRYFEAINRIGYYRLTGYFLPFQDTKSALAPHNFNAGIKFDDVIELYEFDTEARGLIVHALEKLEIAIRVSICEVLCTEYGAHWFMDPASLEVGKHVAILEEAAKHLDFDLTKNQPYWQGADAAALKSRQLFVDHYYGKYNDPKLPAAWMLREVASFGFWARVYDAMKSGDKKKVANQWKYADGNRIDDELLSSWFWSLSILRNRCAHHNRILMRNFPFTPKIPAKDPNKNLFYSKTNDLRTLLVILRILISHSFPGYDLKRKLLALFNSYPGVDLEKATGFGLEGHDTLDKTSFWVLP